MKANELRIGNLVYLMTEVNGILIPNASMAFKVLQIELFKCNVLAYDKIPAEEVRWPTMSYNMITPIPLTEEWLLKFGFITKKKLSGHIGYYRDGWYLIPGIDIFEFIPEGSSIILSKMKYVHQLQNLYFALTGTELTIKSE